MILTNATLLTFWGREPLVEGGLVAIEGKTIVDFGKIGKLADRYEDAETIDLEGRIVLPGQIDLHAQLHRTLIRGAPSRGIAPRTHRELHEQVWWKLERALDSEGIYLSALVGLLDAVRSGVTTVVDSHSSPQALEGSLDALRRAYSEVGARGVLSYSASDREGEAGAIAGIEENRRFVEQVRLDKTDMIRGLFGVAGSSAVSDSTLDRAVNVARSLGSAFHLPLSEDTSDVEKTRKTYEKTPVERFLTAGALTPGTLACHSVHLEGKDVELLKQSGAWVVHCPQSNAAHAVGMVDLTRLRSAGVPVALGSGGFGPGLMEEVRSTMLQQRAFGRSPVEARELAARAAFNANPQWTTTLFGPPIGRIKPGARADLVIVDYDPPTPMSRDNLLEHLVTGVARAPVRMVIINGKTVYREGTFLHLDEAAIRARAREAAVSLWKRMSAP